MDFLKFPDESAETLEIPARTVNVKSRLAIAVLPLFSFLRQQICSDIEANRCWVHDVLPGFLVLFFRIVLVANASHRPMLEGSAPSFENGSNICHCLLDEQMKQGVVSRRYATCRSASRHWVGPTKRLAREVLRIDWHLSVASPGFVFKRGPQPDIRPTTDLMAVQSLPDL